MIQFKASYQIFNIFLTILIFEGEAGRMRMMRMKMRRMRRKDGEGRETHLKTEISVMSASAQRRLVLLQLVISLKGLFRENEKGCS